MNLTTISISPDEAEQQLREYTTLPFEQRTIEDESIAMALRAAKRGHSIIVMSEVIRSGGFFDDDKRPRLALARADAKNVRVFRERGDVVYDTTGSTSWNSINRGALVGDKSVRIRDVVPRDDRTWTGFKAGTTVVPTIPPRLRPKGKRLGIFHILWEVEKWDPTPPVDPALVRHIRGDLWAVIATWDLSPLERAVLAARV